MSHNWQKHERDGWTVCAQCGMVRNYDKETACRGAVPSVDVRRFSAEKAAEVCANNYAPPDPAFGGTPPQVFFDMWDDTTLLAAPEGALLQCDWLEPRKSRVTVTEEDGAHVAVVVAETPVGSDDTEEAIAIASALYWSWWRAWKLRQLRERCLPTEVVA